MNSDEKLSVAIGAIFIGAIKLAFVIPLIWWLFPRLPIIEDIIALFR